MDNDVQVFRTNIESLKGADRLKEELSALYPSSMVSFDLEDCDKILRIETRNQIDTNQIILIGQQLGVVIEILED